MKKVIYTIAVSSIFGLFLNSCGEKKETKEVVVEDVVSEVKTACVYSLENESVEVNWTAFKLSEKVGVAGTFDTISVSGFLEGKEELSAALENMSFVASVNSTNSNSPDRDVKIKEQFFGTMEMTTAITGRIESITSDGNGMLLINMNGMEVSTPFTWTHLDNLFSLNATIDINDWNAGESLSALNTVCEALHTGVDGISKLWPDVEISAQATIKQICE